MFLVIRFFICILFAFSFLSISTASAQSWEDEYELGDTVWLKQLYNEYHFQTAENDNYSDSVLSIGNYLRDALKLSYSKKYR